MKLAFGKPLKSTSEVFWESRRAQFQIMFLLSMNKLFWQEPSPYCPIQAGKGVSPFVISPMQNNGMLQVGFFPPVFIIPASFSDLRADNSTKQRKF